MSGIIWCRFNISVLVQLSTALICYVWSICDDNFMLSKFLPWFFSLEPKIYNITRKIPQIHSVHNFWTIPKHNNALMKGVEKPQAWQNFVWLDGIYQQSTRGENEENWTQAPWAERAQAGILCKIRNHKQLMWWDGQGTHSVMTAKLCLCLTANKWSSSNQCLTADQENVAGNKMKQVK